MRTKVLTSYEKIYPDKGGYTGFSLCIWKLEGKKTDEIALTNKWGSVHPDRTLKETSSAPECIFEGRFFLYGVLMVNVWEKGRYKDLRVVVDKLFGKWKVVLNGLIKKEQYFKENPPNCSMFDAVVTPGTWVRLFLCYPKAKTLRMFLIK